MKFTSRFRRKKPYEAVTEEERISRYVYLLNTLPASVVEEFPATPLGTRFDVVGARGTASLRGAKARFGKLDDISGGESRPSALG